MPRTLDSPRHEALRKFLVEKRLKAGMSQHELARALEVSQSYVATIETGQRRVDVVELLELAKVLQFDAAGIVRTLGKD